MPFYSFRDYYYYLLEESSRKNESAINKISKLFLLKDGERVLSKFKEIFDIEDNTIKLQKVEIGGTKSRHKLLKLMKQYYLTIKTLRRDVEDFYLVEINEPFI